MKVNDRVNRNALISYDEGGEGWWPLETLRKLDEQDASTQLLSPRNYMNNDTTAAAIAYDCFGVYLETDY